MHSKTKKIIVSALMAALVCVATMIVKVPSPLKGYINLGDGIVLLSGWILSPGYGFLAAGLGSAFADLFSGYFTYVPATFIIKGLMALIAFASFNLLSKKIGKILAYIVGGVLAEILMIVGYYVFEGFLYGFVPSAVNIPANAVQGVAGIVIGTVLIKILEKTNVDLKL
jgi:uncharacterized membrane protein